MKVTDLMIGDWVNARDEEGGENDGEIIVNKYPIQIEANYGETILDNNGCERVDKDMEPIPLTHDIIKANGFELTEVGDNGPGTPRQNLNRYEKHECKTKWRDITMWYDRMTKNWCLHGINSIKLNYVHELQHAMRLCGIDKEITL